MASADADFVEAHARFLRGRGAQARAAEALIEARIALGLAIARLGTLPELVRHEYLLARARRDHEHKQLELAHLKARLESESRMLVAKNERDSLMKKPEPEAPPSPGLPLSTVSEILETFAERSPDLRTTLRQVFEAALDDRSKR